MLTARALVLNRIIGPYTRHFTQSACQAGKAPSGLLNVRALSSELDHRAAREWTAGFLPDDIPKTAYEVTYARSSGPGGQHVNKTSSKAVLRCGLDSALGSWLPRYVLEPLTKTTHYVANPPSLLIASQTSRSASENTSIALALLYKTIITAAKSPIIGETSAEQKEKVKAHAVMENARRRFNKDKRKDTKAARRGEW